MSYILKRKIRKYRKKFVLPVLTSNGTMGGDTFAVNCSTPKTSVYEMFNTGADGTKGVDTYSNAAPQWVSFYNPVPLKVTKLRIGQIKNTQAQYYYITAYKIQVSDDNQTWTDVYSGTGSKPATTLTANIADSGYHKYYRVYVTSAPYYSGYPRVFFFGIDFEAEAENAVFYDDIVKSYVAKRKIRKYYKYKYEDGWTRPNLSSEGTIGSNIDGCKASLVYSSYYSYLGLNGNRNNSWIANTTTGWLMYYSPILVKPETMSIYTGTGNDTIKSGIIQASEDGINWKDILSFSNPSSSREINFDVTYDKPYKYHRCYVTSISGSGWVYIYDWSMAGKKATLVEVSASDDYDFYEDTITTYTAARK